MITSVRDRINRWYEPQMRVGRRLIFDKIGFFNFGYWKDGCPTVELAQINLIETLAGFLSRGAERSVLDVACGKGASCKFLTKYFYGHNITGINVIEEQLQTCRVIAPECAFRLMDATQLEFEDASFDNILCIEAAFHFMTRHKFFEQAHRVLRSGGRLAMSDIVVHDYDLVDLGSDIPREAMPAENCLPSLDAYRALLAQVGFRYVRVEDTTAVSVGRYLEYKVKALEAEFVQQQDPALLEEATRVQRLGGSWPPGSTWCMVFAIK